MGVVRRPFVSLRCLGRSFVVFPKVHLRRIRELCWNGKDSEASWNRVTPFCGVFPKFGGSRVGHFASTAIQQGVVVMRLS